MVAVEQPRADCGHAAALTQQCGRCLRWCCPECYVPWTALACGACRAEARSAAARAYAADTGAPRARARVEADGGDEPAVVTPGADAGCRSGRTRARGTAGARRHRERADVRTLAARVADLERRLSELGPDT
ncbi:MAG TPA: hypothetical protein VFE55_21115 [Acidimicrobiia bacterium]|nr:hypothetical protein [Acidimicrobiia bacterium]